MILRSGACHTDRQAIPVPHGSELELMPQPQKADALYYEVN